MHKIAKPLSTLDTIPENAGNMKLKQSILISGEMCNAIKQQLSAQFQVTLYTPGVELGESVAYLTDCRGKAIAYSENIPAATMPFALVNQDSFLPSESTEKDNQLELVTENELTNGIFLLRIAARLRKSNTAPHKIDAEQNIVKDNAYEILKVLMQYSTDWMVIKDLDHRFLSVSSRFLKSNRNEPADVIGKNDLEIGTRKELVLGDSSNNFKGYWANDDEVIASKEIKLSQHMIIHESALEQVREHVARVPIKNKNNEVIALFVCVTQAYSSKINGASELTLASRQNIELSPIIKKLEDDRSEAMALTQETKTAIKRKNNFIATASHDLRQPLHAIGFFIESLQKNITDPSQSITLSKMKQSSQDLNALLNSILDISKLDAEAVAVNNTHFAIAPLLKSIEDEFENVAFKKSISLNINNTSSVVNTDSLLLSRILKNLVSNAIKYTSEGSVNLLTEVTGENLVIRIKDTGPGIPKEQYQSVFLEYHQIKNQHTQPNLGMGLGLSIVKRLVELLKLDLTLDSETDRGTEFSLTIPLGNAQHNLSTEGKDHKNEAFDSFKLLVIDDNQIVLDAMTEVLTSMDCEAYPALNISEALEIISELEDLPDLLVVDYQLENGVTGDMAIEQVCIAANKNIPAIIVTGNTSNALVRKAAESAYRVLNKPVNPKVLLRNITSAVKEHKASIA